jgi:hypothetical protein
VGTGLLSLVDAVGVVVRAEILVTGPGVGEQVPDDDQDRSGDSDQRFELAAAFDDPPVALAEDCSIGIPLSDSRETKCAETRVLPMSLRST